MEKESISYINLGDGENYPIDAVTVGGKSANAFQESKLVTTINASSNAEHFPSTMAVYTVLGVIESRLQQI